MAISLRKTIPDGLLDASPESDWYNYGGDKTITLNGTTKFIAHTKKKLIKVPGLKSKKSQTIEDSDKFSGTVVDLKDGADEIVINGWIEDDSTDTAWEKYWRLRAMTSRGGPLTNLTIDNIQFKSDTQQAFLEDITGTIIADDTGALNTKKDDGTARIEITLKFFIGQER